MWQVGGSSGDLGSDGTQQKCLDEMAQELWRQAKAGELTDVEIKLDDGTVLKSHRGVLSARSRVFKGMFLSEMEEAKTGKVKICDVSAPAFKAFLSFVYTGRLLSEACDGSELWGLADIYEVISLKECILSDLGEHNVIGALRYSSGVAGAEEVIEACVAVCMRSLPLVGQSESLQGLTAEECRLLMSRYTGALGAFQFLQRWRTQNPNAEGLEDALRSIDMRLISSSDLIKVVKPSGLVSAEALNELYERRLKAQEWATQSFSHLHTITNGEGTFNRPVGVAAIQTGGREAIVVIDQDNNRVHVCDLADTTVRRFGSRGDGFGRFLNPVGVAVGEGNILYVCDHDRHEVQVFREDGTWISTLGKEGTGRGEFLNPRDVCVSPDGSIVICDKGNNRIQIWKPDGRHIMSFGTEGTHQGQFKSPCGVACCAQGRIFVADSGNARVCVFDCNGGYLQQFGSRGDEPGQFQSPEGIAVAPEGDVLVSDWAKHRISIFRNDDLSFVQSFGQGGDGRGRFAGPAGIAICSNGSVVVADQLHHRVQIWGSL